MAEDTRGDAFFVLAVAAALAASLLAGLLTAPGPLPPEPPPLRPALPAVPAGTDPFALDEGALARLRSALGAEDRAAIEKARAGLAAALTAPVPDVEGAEKALLSLATLGDRAAPFAAELLARESRELRRAGARLAGFAGSPLLVPALVPLLEDPDWEVQADAAEALGRIGDRSAVVDLLKWRAELANRPRHPVPKIRVAEALLRLGNSSAVPWLLGAVYSNVSPDNSPVFEGDMATRILREQTAQNFGFDRESHRRANDAAALRWCRWWKEWEGWFRPLAPAPDRTDTRRLTARLLQERAALKGERYYLQHFGRLLVARCGALAQELLLASLYEGDPSDPLDRNSHMRLNAAETLRMMVEMRVQPAPDKALLAAHLNQVLSTDAAPTVRAAAAGALAVLGDRRSVEPLLAGLERDPDPSARVACARALQRLGFADAVPPLEALARAPGLSPLLRAEIRAALESSRLRPALGPFVEALEEAFASGDRDLSEEAASRLAELSGRRTAWSGDEEVRAALLASWKRTVEYEDRAHRLVGLFQDGAVSPDFRPTAAVLAALLGPKAPHPPRKPRAVVDHVLAFRDLWKTLAAIRAALEADELDVPGLVNGGDALAAVTGRSNGFHPRTDRAVLFKELEIWEAWARDNGPGCDPAR